MIPGSQPAGGTLFYVMCPGENERYHKLMIFHDGTVNRNLKYKDVCPVAELESEPEYHNINIAYNNYPGWFHVDDTNTMEEYPLSKTLKISKNHIQISFSWEILKLFFNHFNIIPSWINCNQTWGWIDEDTGKWTGAVGKVIITNLSLQQFNLFLLKSLKVEKQT